MWVDIDNMVSIAGSFCLGYETLTAQMGSASALLVGGITHEPYLQR